MKLINCLALPLAMAVAATAYAGDEDKDTGLKLNVGDKAPEIDVAHWIKGDAITEFEEGNIYVVEFWATWCGPCKASMPHISEIQEKMKDYKVTVIGISDEPLQTVAAFLVKTDNENKMWWDKTRYTLATDPDRSVYKDYMQAAGQNGIPTSFVVGKEGHIEWIGHPMNLDTVLEDVVHDNWDRDAYLAKWKQEMAAEANFNRLFSAWREAQANEDWNKAQATADEIIALGEQYDSFKINKFMTFIGPMNEPTKGYAYGNELLKDYWDNEAMLNQIAWLTVDSDGIQTRDLKFALKAAEQANKLSDSSDGAILDTLARVYYEMGDLKNALKFQKMAVENATDQFRPQLEEALKKYESEAKAKK